MTARKARQSLLRVTTEKLKNPATLTVTRDLPTDINPFDTMRRELDDLCANILASADGAAAYSERARLIRPVLNSAEQHYNEGYARRALLLVWQAGWLSTFCTA